MKALSYSQDIANVIKGFLAQQNWSFIFKEESGIFCFSIALNCELEKLNYFIIISKGGYLIRVTSPIDADANNPQMIANMAEFVCRANQKLNLEMGQFDFDCDNGKIGFAVLCKDEAPSAESFMHRLYCSETLFAQYAIGIISIIFNGASAKEAIEQSEKTGEDTVIRILETLFGKNEKIAEVDSDDADSILSKLYARFGGGGTENKSPSRKSSTETEGEIHTDLFRRRRKNR